MCLVLAAVGDIAFFVPAAVDINILRSIVGAVLRVGELLFVELVLLLLLLCLAYKL